MRRPVVVVVVLLLLLHATAHATAADVQPLESSTPVSTPLKPLVYITIFCGKSYYVDMLKLLLQSMTVFGKYSGDLLLITDEQVCLIMPLHSGGPLLDPHQQAGHTKDRSPS